MRDGKRITVTFVKAGKGLHIKGDSLSALKVLAQDVKTAFDKSEEELAFTAETEGNHLVITLNEDTDKPVKVAFARTSWYLVNLYNEADIPAIPFEFVVTV